MGEFAQLDKFLTQEGSSSSSKSSLLPTPVSPAWYDPESKSWYSQEDFSGLSKKEKESLFSCVMYCQYAPTGRARCRRCGGDIQKGELRLGYPYRWRQADDCYTLYLHPECYESSVFGIKEKDLRKKIYGYEALNNTERARLWKEMRSEGRMAKANKEGANATAEYSSGSVGVDTKSLPEVPVPKDMAVPMLPFQKEGLAWMCQQEESSVRGGILADEMGMGKTIQAISLLLARPVKGPALVVCPMAAVNQWMKEIEKFTKKGTLKTLVYHGSEKGRVATQFKKCDVVITTYQTLESDYRREAHKHRVKCKYCGKLFMPEKLTFHQRYFCGPNAEKTKKQQKTAAKKAMQSMGIGNSKASSSTDAPPTITNIYRDFMKQAGVTVKSKGYWNVMKETQERLKGSFSSSSSKGGDDVLSRERLALLDRKELVELCDKKGLDSTGRKPELVDRLMDFAVRGTTSKAEEPVKKVSLAMKLLTSAKTKAKAEAASANKTVGKSSKMKTAEPGKAGKRMPLLLRKGSTAASKYQGVSPLKSSGKWQASYQGKYLGSFDTELKAAKAVRDAAEAAESKGKGKKAAASAASGMARTVASRGAEASGSSSRGKRKREEMEEGGDPYADYETFEGAQLDLTDSPLHTIQWARVILDEAHRIKGRTNSTALAAYALQTQKGYKWCLTGTPLQNRVGELYSLIRFLRVRPYAFYYCKKQGCKCECACFMRDRYCPNCGHVRFMHYSSFKKDVSNPIIKYGYMGAGKVGFQKLCQDILQKCMLRRTKEERKADLQLPPIKVCIRKDKLSKQETDFYSSIYMQSCVKFDTFVHSGTVLHNYAHIFDLLTSLRRAVDHPYLIVYGGGQATHRLPQGKTLLAENAGNVCGLCQDDVNEGGEEVKRQAKCGHVFHDECIRAYIADAPTLKSGGVGCPVCFTKLHIDLEDVDDENSGDEKTPKRKSQKAPAASTPAKTARTSAKAAPKAKAKSEAKPAMLALPAPDTEGANTKSVAKGGFGPNSIMKKVKASDFQSSTKIEALLDEINQMISGDPSAKGIVFSQFGSMLELVEFRMKRAGISCVVFRGGMSMQARDDALAAFNEDPTLKVILISLKAGGEGLNLQVANHVFLLDPWWNPACEMQAIQRAHRIGQTRPVKAVRFITADTIEEKIIKLQDLRFLFQH